MLDVPNLEGLNDDELKELDDAFTKLAIITDAIIRARDMRRRGDVECALAYEALVDTWYKRLPSGVVRW